MHYWFQAFTHETFNPEITENYENLEYFGDKVSGSSFALLLFEMRGGRIDKNELTAYQGVYMSEDFQTLVGIRTFGFTNWLRCGINKISKMNEDVFESFVGALHQAGDNCKKGWGFYLCRLFINFVCSKIVLTEDDSKGTYLQRAIQNPEKINLKGEFKFVEYKKPDGTIIIKYTLSNKAIERIRQLGFDKVPSDGVMGIGVATKKKKAQIRAGIEAVKKFDEIGLTQKVFDEFQRNRALKLIKKENYELYELTNKKLEEEGFKDTYQFEVATSKSKNREFYTITLTGINKKGKTITLGVGKNENKLEAYTEAATQYVSRI
jgi:dsRNA-specific ribonuclease